MGIVGLVSGIVSITSVCCIVPSGVKGWLFLAFPLLVSFPLCLVTWVTARRDLHMMRAGLMDREGEEATQRAWDMGLSGVSLSFVVAVFLSFVAYGR
jgi:hypothetical protein